MNRNNKNKHALIILSHLKNANWEKYIRETWMLKANPTAEHTVEIAVEDGQCSGN
jgi:hypothetical protein